MPALVITQTKETVRMDAHGLFTANQIMIASSAYNKLDAYSLPGGGSMPTYEWSSPDGVFIYENGVGELKFDGVPFSSIGSDAKNLFFRWLPHFIHKAMRYYNKQYGL